MKITRLGPDVLSFEDGREIQYEADPVLVEDEDEETHYENSREVSRTVRYTTEVYKDVTTDPEVIREERAEIVEFLNGENGI
jgi:hypothetical protein